MKIGIMTPATDLSIFLDEAITSVRHDQGAEIEHVIVHDGSESFAAAIGERHPHVRVIRGQGRGVGAAMILGFDALDADFLIQLNSDDRLGPDCIARLVERGRERPEVQIWTGGTVLFKTDHAGREREVRRLQSREETAFTLANLLDDLPSFTARFCRQAMYESIGGPDPSYVHCNDREFMVRALMAGIKEAPLDCIVAEMRMHPGSKTLSEIGSRVPEFLVCHLELADLWLGRDDLPGEVRRSFAAWRAREVLRLVSYQARILGPGKAFDTVLEQTLRQPWWPLLAFGVFGAVRRRHRGLVR